MSESDSRVGTTFGKYTITGVLGKGGMGEVYEARDNEIGRTVALKIIKSVYAHDRGYRARFERESHAAAMLQEPHVIPIHSFGEIDGSLYIDMRLVRGDDLQTLLERGPLQPARAVAIVGQIAAALDAAHAEGLIHRDVKPQNIIVTPADFAYLLDFGIAEVVGDTRLTAIDARVGSWSYMAPERFSRQDTTPAADVYSLACVLYEALTASLPFPVQSQEAQIGAHLTSPPPEPSVVNPDVPEAFDDVIARGMAKEPDDRYGSAGALGRAAARALAGAGRTAVDPAPRAARPAPAEAPTQYAPPPRYDAPAPGYPPAPPADQRFYPPSGPQQVVYPPSGPQPVAYPPSGPQPAGPARPSAERSRWLIPTVLAVSAALVLATVGVVIGLLASQNSGSGHDAAPTTTMISGSASYSPPTPGTSEPTSAPTTPHPSVTVQPPIITGPDQSPSHVTCDSFQYPQSTGFGSRSGRGSPTTSCYFANSVLFTYWNTYGNADTSTRYLSAPGAVSCTTVGIGCDPRNTANFLMTCAGDGGNQWIKCVGGNQAVVYLW